MDIFFSRTVFFVSDGERALKYYTDDLGFTLDWTYEEEGKPYVFQVSLLGLQLIMNQTGPDTADRAGRGRIFIGLDDDQSEPFHRHIAEHKIETKLVRWGEPTVAIYDPDGNEIYFWLPDSEREPLREQLEAKAAAPAGA